MKYLFYLFAFVFIYKVSKNTYYYFRLQKLYSYFKTITSEKEEKIDNRAFETKSEVIELFKKASVEDNLIPTIKHVGSGYAVPYKVSCFSSYPTNSTEEFVISYVRMFDEAKGTFKHRAKEVLNPFYWIDSILFAPKNLLNYIGVSPESRSTKILNIVLTSIYWFLGIFVAIFKEKIHTFLLSYLP